MPHRWSCRPRVPVPALPALTSLIVAVTLLTGSSSPQTGAPSPTPGSEAQSAEPALSSTAVSVIVPVRPYALIVDRIAAGRANAFTLVPPGQSPHTYSPTPQQIAAFAEADVLFHVGLELERSLVPRLAELDRELLIVSLMPIDMEPRDAHEDVDGHDPHVWLNPLGVIGQATVIAETLARLDPDGRETYAAGLDSLVRDLARLDADLTAQLTPYAGSRFYVFHPAFGHFAEAYGLEQVAVETDGKEPGAKRLAQLVEAARADGADVIITQAQHSDALVRTLAREIGAEIMVIDPLAYDLLATIRALAHTVTRDGEVDKP